MVAVNPLQGFCAACFTGAYPVPIPESFSRGSFLPGYKPNNLVDPSPTSLMSVEEVTNVLALCREEAQNIWGEEIRGASSHELT